MLTTLARRFSIVAFFTVQFLQFSNIGTALTRWSVLWSDNRSQILVLAGINTSLTTVNELIAREVSSRFIDKSPENSFFVKHEKSFSINRQSLVNIWMTLIASLFGGVIFFMRRKWCRFTFFCAFGLCVCIASQCMGHLIRDGRLYIDSARLGFDAIYLMSIKYLVFEFGREEIIFSRENFSRLSTLRLVQDLFTTLLRVIALNLTGFKG